MKACVRCLWMLCFLVVGNLICYADTTDKNLERAKAEYETEMSEIKKLVLAFLDKQETSARKSGNKPLLDWTKVESENLEKSGALPQARPANIQKKFDSAYEKLETAFTTAIKEYTKAKRDADAASAVKEFRGLRLSRLIAGFQFQGAWQTKHDSGWSGSFVVDGPNIEFRGDNKILTWSRDGATVTIHWPDGGWETVTINPDFPRELRGATPGGTKLTWVRTK